MKAIVAIVVALSGCVADTQEVEELQIENSAGKADGENTLSFEIGASEQKRIRGIQCRELLWCDSDVRFYYDQRAILRAAEQYFDAKPSRTEYYWRLGTAELENAAGAPLTSAPIHLGAKVVRTPEGLRIETRSMTQVSLTRLPPKEQVRVVVRADDDLADVHTVLLSASWE